MNRTIAIVIFLLLSIQFCLGQNVIDTIASYKELDEIVVESNQAMFLNKTEAIEIASVDAEYLQLNRSSSLMASLDKIPGVKSMQIGQGFSKPMIRGLSFNRVAVLQNGIKQQGQQWGADHGLEIDQYDVANIEIYKGASSLQFGSDAIAGVISLKPALLRSEDGLNGTLQMNGASNNRLFGASANLNYQKQQKYIQGRYTYQNFEDYRVPANSFNYLGWTYPLHKKILKNTAGREANVSVQAGIVKERYTSNLLVTNVYAKTGFFAGAHGIPTEVSLEDDGKYRDIGLPYQRVNHLKFIYNQSVKLNDKHEINFDLGYQNNNRKEFSKPHTHGIGELPDTNLELELKLQTASLNFLWINRLSDKNRLSIGTSAEYQDNDIGGYSFLLPQFEQIVGAVYVIERLRLSNKIVLNSGVRYDYGWLKIHEFIDPHLSEEYKQRATNLSKNMGDVSFSAGISYAINTDWNMKLNLGKSFRMTTANELSSNGVHHGTFRHELGDSKLKPEQSYQIDYSIEYNKNLNLFFDRIGIQTNIFANYFPNFIFLNPTGNFSWLPDAGQYYRYEQSNAFRTGGEFQLKLDFGRIFSYEGSMEYVYAKDLDSKYPIPFTPPLSVANELSMTIDKIAFFKENRFAIAHRFTDAQNRVSRNELKTPSYQLIDLSLSIKVPSWKQQNVNIIFQVQNLFNEKYYNHISFYRYLDLPEIGRNLRLSIIIPIA